MCNKISSLILLLVPFLCFAGCDHSQTQVDEHTGGGEVGLKAQSMPSETSAQKVSEKRQHDPETAKIIRKLASAAAGISNSDFKKLAGNGQTPNPDRIENHPMTLIVLTDIAFREKGLEDRHDEFRFTQDIPNPQELIDSLKPFFGFNKWSALQLQYIQDVTCFACDNTATGVIDFDSGQFAGKVHYTASKVNQNWQIDEFSFPVRDWRFVRKQDGTWQWFDHFGLKEKDRELPMQEVVGQVLIDGKPMKSGRVYLTMEDYPEFVFGESRIREDSFKVSLLPGKYIVDINSKELANGRNGRGGESKSGSTIDIAEGQTEVILKIKSTPE